MAAAKQLKLPGQPDDDLYLAARQEDSDCYANLAAGKRNWQMAAFSTFAIAAMCGVVAIIQVRKPAEVPYVVMLDRSDGYAFTFPTPPTASGPSIDLNQVEQQAVAAFIRSARAVVADVKGEDAVLNFVKQHAAGDADRFLGDYFTSLEHRPYLVSRESFGVAILLGAAV